jgi:hypothetical protein
VRQRDDTLLALQQLKAEKEPQAKCGGRVVLFSHSDMRILAEARRL